MAWATATDGPDWSNGPWATLFLRKMLENPAFKERFITRFADHLYITYNPATINLKVDQHANWIRAEMPNQIDRWLGTTSSYGDAIPSLAFWENEVNKLKQFGVQRNTFMLTDLNNYFGLQGVTSLQLDVSPANRGTIRLHDLQVPSYPWTGKYFQNRTITLTAEAKPGFSFDHWERSKGSQVTVFPPGSTWKFYDATSAPPAAWHQPGFDDSVWKSGPAQLGYGDGDENTQLSFGGNSGNKTPSYYFRTTFSVADPSQYTGLLARLVADDGAVVYINGQEVGRINMPASPAVISFNTFALSSVSGSAESAWNELTLPGTLLQPGENHIAVEIHQSDPGSSDISFDFELEGNTASQSEIVSTQPQLDVTLDAQPTTFRAVFESDGTCGILPDTIRQDQTLILACSPYTAAGDVIVNPNVTLTVEAGVEIQFPEKASLWVRGALQIEGQENAPVVIKPVAGNQQWGGIFLSNTTAPSSLSYTTLVHASAGTQRLYYPAAISAYHADIVMDHLDLTQVDDNPVFARFSNVELRYSRLKSSVTGDCINVKNGFATVEYCEFEGGTQPDMDAIDYDGVTGGVIRQNRIHDFRGDNCDGLDIGEQCQDLVIENNFIYHCFDKGISVGQQSTATVRNNVIAYTNIGIALKDESHVVVEHCTFFGNQQGVSAYEKNEGNLGGTGQITDCIVSNASLDAYDYDDYSGLTLTRCLSDLDSINGPGTWNTDPHFVNPTWYDFNLLPISPAIGLGTNHTNLGANPLPVYSGEPQVLISEILYNDTLTSTGEFIELYNPGSAAVDLSGYVLAAAVDFTFPSGAAIPSHGFVVIAKDATTFQGVSYPVYEWTDGKLKNEGEIIQLFDANGLLVDFVRYDNHTPWPEGDALAGRSLELVADNLDNHFATSWKPSADPGGTPGSFPGITAVPPALSEESITVYPNPVSGSLHILMKETSGSYSIVLYDMSGHPFVHRNISQGHSLQDNVLDVTGLSAGTYNLVVSDQQDHVLWSRSIVVQ